MEEKLEILEMQSTGQKSKLEATQSVLLLALIQSKEEEIAWKVIDRFLHGFLGLSENRLKMGSSLTKDS